MKHLEHYKIQWHDTNANREVHPSRILTYMQETANAHLIANGIGLDLLRDQRGLAFLLSRISLRFYHPLYMGDEIDVETWIAQGRGFGFDRFFRIWRGNEVIAEAHSIWALLNLREKRLMRVEEFSYGFPPDPPLETRLQTRVRLPALEQMACVGERRIVFSDIDYNQHMNNTNYPNMLCDFIPDIASRRPVAMILSFLHEAAFEHTLKIYRAPREMGYDFRTVDADGSVCLEATVLLEELNEPYPA